MDLSLASYLVLAAAFATANLPFLNERLFGFLPLPGAVRAPDGAPRTKRFLVRLVELVVLYFVVGALAYALESRIGSAFAQSWQFYATTGCLFLVFAFPGFVLRYLRKRRS